MLRGFDWALRSTQAPREHKQHAERPEGADGPCPLCHTATTTSRSWVCRHHARVTGVGSIAPEATRSTLGAAASCRRARVRDARATVELVGANVDGTYGLTTLECRSVNVLCIGNERETIG